MKKRIITIGRKYGSGGHIVGKLLARKLDLPYYDKELLFLAARKGNLAEEKFLKFDEKPTNFFLYQVNYSGNEHVNPGESMEDTLYHLQEKTILEIGGTGPAVIVGRCADAILEKAGYEVLSVFIDAPLEYRIDRIMLLEGWKHDKAKKLIKKLDKRRKNYYESHTGKKWGDMSSYHLYFDCSKYVSYEDIANQIIRLYQGTT